MDSIFMLLVIPLMAASPQVLLISTALRFFWHREFKFSVLNYEFDLGFLNYALRSDHLILFTFVIILQIMVR